jgi:hypothetical protein
MPCRWRCSRTAALRLRAAWIRGGGKGLAGCGHSWRPYRARNLRAPDSYDIPTASATDLATARIQWRRVLGGLITGVGHVEFLAAAVGPYVLPDAVGIAGHGIGLAVARAGRPAVRGERGDTWRLDLAGELVDLPISRDLVVQCG